MQDAKQTLDWLMETHFVIDCVVAAVAMIPGAKYSTVYEAPEKKDAKTSKVRL